MKTSYIFYGRPSADTRKHFHDTLNYMRSRGLGWEFMWEYKECRKEGYTIIEAVNIGYIDNIK